jgi:voltage-dependent potassium channel beta subunit
VSVLGLGAGNWGYLGMDEKNAAECVAIALEQGINYFDNAQSYTNGQAELIMGRIFKRLALPRIKYVIATKFMYGLAERYWEASDSPNDRHTLNRKFLIDGIDGSLKKLQMDYVDIIYCHRPDPDTPIEETVWALHNIIEWGKALYWGTSEWSAEEIRAAWEIAERHHLHKPIVEQPEFNLLRRRRVETELSALCTDTGIGIAAYSPLSGGTLTGKYLQGAPPDSRGADPAMHFQRETFVGRERNLIVAALQTIAQELGCPLAHLALAWCVRNPMVCNAILGVTRPEQLRDNLRSVEVLPKLTAEVMARVDAAVGSYSADAYQVPRQ